MASTDRSIDAVAFITDHARDFLRRRLRELAGLLLAGATRWSPLYVGVLPLLLGLGAAWWTLASDGRAARRHRFWTLLAGVALALSLGGAAFVFDLFYLAVPGFALFRGQERSAFLVSFSLAMLAGGPFEDWRGAAGYVTALAPHDPVYLQSAWTRDAFAQYYRGDAPLLAPPPATGEPRSRDNLQPATGSAWLVVNDHPSLHHEITALRQWLAGANRTTGPARTFPRYLQVAPIAASP